METIEDITELYHAIRNSGYELVEHLSYIKDQLLIAGKSSTEYESKIVVAIEGYDALESLFKEENEFFKLIKKDKELNEILLNIHTLIVSIVNFEDFYDQTHDVTRENVIEWKMNVTDLFNNIEHSLKEEKYFSTILEKIKDIELKNHLILEEGSEDQLFNFYYIYKTSDYIKFIEDSYNLLMDLQREPIPNVLLLDIIDILSKLPLSYNLHKLFK